MWEALAQLGQALEKCRSTPVWTLSGGVLESCVDELFRLRAQFDALSLALLREADARAVAVGQGATSTTAWLRDGQRVSIHTASRLVKLAAAMDADLPATAQALAAGKANLEQVGVITHAVAELPAEHRPKGERFLLDQAGTFGPHELEVLGRRLFEVVAPQEAAQREADQLARAEQRAYEKRDFRLTDTGSGQVRLSGTLDTSGAAVVRAALDPLCAPHPDDLRSPGQRRADALVDVCRIAMSCGNLPDNGGEPPQIVITMDLGVLPGGIGAATLHDAPQSAPPRPDAWPARPASSPSYSAARDRSSTWAANGACSPAHSAAPSSSETAAAPSRATTVHPAGAKRTTSDPGPTVDRHH